MHSSNIVYLCIYVRNTQSTSPNGEFSQVSGRLYFFLFQMRLYVLFSISFLIYCGQIWPICQNVEKRVWLLTIMFSSQRESHSVPERDFFATLLLISSNFDLSRIELPKLTSCILMEIVAILVVLVDQFNFYMHQPINPWTFEKNYPFNQFIFAFSFGFKVTCILLGQVISLEKIVLLSAKFIVLI